jgi:cytochrome c peroxidase
MRLNPGDARRLAVALMAASLLLSGCDDDDGDDGQAGEDLDAQVRAEITAHGLTGDPTLIPTAGIQAAQSDDQHRVLPDIAGPLAQLGKLLFFTKGLGGDEDSACVSCHHPLLGGGDALALPIGTEAELPDLLGPGRVHRADGHAWDGGPTVPRNAPTTFNIALWDRALFLDGRVESLGATPGMNGADGQGIRTPDSAFGVVDPNAGDNLPWAQARFPITSNEEMRGHVFVAGESNDALRAALEERFQSDERFAGWLELFREAFGAPEGSAEELLTVDNIARAIGEYQRSQVFVETPWKAYVQGDDLALDDAAKRGALLFLRDIEEGGAGCARCHSGDFFTDEDYYVLAIPQIGRGKGDGATGDDDFGRMRESGADADKYAFRTPTLLDVEVTGPYGHSGAYTSLRDVVVHHLDPAGAVADYFAQLNAYLAPLQHNGYAIQVANAQANTEAALARLQANLDAGLDNVPFPLALSDAEVDDLVAFLLALTDPRVSDRSALAPWIARDPDPDPDGLRVNATTGL